MTVIAAVKHDGNVYMGGDSAGVHRDSIVANARPKVFTTGQWIAGSSGLLRLQQRLQYGFTWPEPTFGVDLHEFMCTEFVDGMRKCLGDKGGEFLIGTQGLLFHVGPEYDVCAVASEYAAIGEGAKYALGSLYSTPTLSATPELRLTLAMSAAERFCPSVREPFTVVAA